MDWRLLIRILLCFVHASRVTLVRSENRSFTSHVEVNQLEKRQSQFTDMKFVGQPEHSSSLHEDVPSIEQEPDVDPPGYDHEAQPSYSDFAYAPPGPFGSHEYLPQGPYRPMYPGYGHGIPYFQQYPPYPGRPFGDAAYPFVQPPFIQGYPRPGKTEEEAIAEYSIWPEAMETGHDVLPWGKDGAAAVVGGICVIVAIVVSIIVLMVWLTGAADFALVQREDIRKFSSSYQGNGTVFGEHLNSVTESVFQGLDRYRRLIASMKH